MPGKRSTVRQSDQRNTLTSHEVHLGERQIARVCRVGKGTVQRFLQRAAAAGLGWPLPEDLDDGQLERLLFPPVMVPAESKQGPDEDVIPKYVNRNITLSLPADLIRPAKTYAAENRMTVNAIVRELLCEKLNPGGRAKAAAQRFLKLTAAVPGSPVDPSSITRGELHNGR